MALAAPNWVVPDRSTLAVSGAEPLAKLSGPMFTEPPAGAVMTPLVSKVMPVRMGPVPMAAPSAEPYTSQVLAAVFTKYTATSCGLPSES